MLHRKNDFRSFWYSLPVLLCMSLSADTVSVRLIVYIYVRVNKKYWFYDYLIRRLWYCLSLSAFQVHQGAPKVAAGLSKRSIRQRWPFVFCRLGQRTYRKYTKRRLLSVRANIWLIGLNQSWPTWFGKRPTRSRSPKRRSDSRTHQLYRQNTDDPYQCCLTLKNRGLRICRPILTTVKGLQISAHFSSID